MTCLHLLLANMKANDMAVFAVSQSEGLIKTQFIIYFILFFIPKYSNAKNDYFDNPSLD